MWCCLYDSLFLALVKITSIYQLTWLQLCMIVQWCPLPTYNANVENKVRSNFNLSSTFSYYQMLAKHIKTHHSSLNTCIQWYLETIMCLFYWLFYTICLPFCTDTIITDRRKTEAKTNPLPWDTYCSVYSKTWVQALTRAHTHLHTQTHALFSDLNSYHSVFCLET